MRVVFLGNARWSVPSLEAVAGSRHEIALVLTRVPRPGGRGNRPIPTPVAEAARRLGLPLDEVETAKAGRGFEALTGAHPDVLAVVAYGEILPKAVLKVPEVPPVNLHFSLLPALRGAAPVQRAILDGLEVTGVTTIRMDEGMDTGPILLQAEEALRPEDDAGALGERLATVGGRLLVETLDGLAAGTIQEHPQDDSRATYAPKVKPDDRVIDWSRPFQDTLRVVRAMAPDPGATTTFRRKGLKVLRASLKGVPRIPLSYKWRPGDVFIWEGELGVFAGDGRVVRLDEVQPEGRNRMSGADFVRGYRPELGERLGEPAGRTSPRG
jgi:methionyl-tRNA formyltransferase